MPKHIFLLFALLLIVSPVTFSAASGLTTGTIVISGDTNFDFDYNKLKDNDADYDVKTTSFQVDATIGYFIMDMVEVGPIFGLERTTTKNGADYTDTTFNLGAYGKYYFDLQSELYPYATANLGYFSEKEENGASVTTKGIYFGAGAGVKYFLNDYFAVDAGLRFTFGKGTIDAGGSDDATLTDVELLAGISVFL